MKSRVRPVVLALSIALIVGGGVLTLPRIAGALSPSAPLAASHVVESPHSAAPSLQQPLTTTARIPTLYLPLVLRTNNTSVSASVESAGTAAPEAVTAPYATGGPDAFGYLFADSVTTPALYNWVDISGSGALVSFLDGDTGVTALDLPAPFAFYDRTYSKLYVTINGYASFAEIFGSDVTAQCNPAQRQPHEALPVFCADLRDGAVYVQTTTAYNGHQTFVVQYHGVTHVGTGASATFQIILDLEMHDVIYQYHTVPPGSADVTAGIIGYAANRADYLTYCQGAGCPPQAALAVHFSPSRPRLDLSIAASNDFAQMGDTLVYSMTLQNTGGGSADGAAMENVLPVGLDYLDGSLQATAGVPTYQAVDRTVRWTGNLVTGAPVTLTYAAALNTDDIIYNSSVLTHPLAVEAAGATSSPAQRWDDGEPLDAPHKFDYRLGSWRHIAVDSSGTRHIAYGGAALYYATQPALSGQAAASDDWTIAVVPGTVADVRYAALILDEQERPVIAFYGDQRLWLARRTAAGWDVGEITALSGWASTNFRLDLAQGSDGALHLVYNELGNASTNSLYYTRYDGTAWSAPVVAVAYPGCAVYSDGFSLAVDAANTPHVACVYKDTTPRQLRLYTYAAAAPWNNSAVVMQGNDFFYYPSLAFDGATAHVAFYQGYRSLYHAEGSGAIWQVSLVDESAPTDYLRQGAALAINGGSVGIAGLLRSGSYGDYTMRVEYASRPLIGGDWATETAATLRYRTDDPRPTLALDSAGQPHLAYYDSTDRTLHHLAPAAVQSAAFASTVVDQSRTLGDAAVALGSDGATHVVWQAGDLYYAVRAAGATTWTKQQVADNPGSPALALAVDGGGAPHLAYGQHNQPLVHATVSGSLWVTRTVDLPGEALGFDIGAGVANNAHLVYVAVAGDHHVLRYAAFDGAGWSSPTTLATLAPTAAYPEQRPKIVVQDGKLYVLYADCTGYQTPNTDYPIALKLATWTAGSWSQRTLYEFAGRCDWQMSYTLDGNGADQLAAIAHITSESVRPNPLVVTFRIEEAAGAQRIDYQEGPGAVRPQPLTPAAPEEEMHAEAMIAYYMVQSMLRGNWGWLSTWTENGARQIQFGDGQGNPSRIIQEATGKSSAMVRDSKQMQGESVLVEIESKENKVRVPRSSQRVAECCLNTQVQPAAAAAAGCTAAPASVQRACGAQVEVTAGNCTGWKFTHWSGAAGGTSATTLATVSGTDPMCSVATAHFAEEAATAAKTATPIMPITATTPGGVYPGDYINYRIDLSWKGPDDAAIAINDPYPRPRVSYIAGSLQRGLYIPGCAVADSLTCNGEFPKSDVVLSTFVSFDTLATCDLYRTTEPFGPLVNRADVQIDGYLFQPRTETEVAVPFELMASTPTFVPSTVFDAGHSVLLYTVPKGNEPDCCTACALDVYLVVDGDTGHPVKMENDGAGASDRSHADLIADDCHHSYWFKPTQEKEYVLDLYVVKRGDPFAPLYKADTLRLAPTTTPALVTLTDLRELYNEFNRTDAHSATQDSNGNCIKDFYESVERLRRYAADHDGVVVDVRQDAYGADYDITKDSEERYFMITTIDWLVSKLPSRPVKDIAIIGNDAVLPFYRYPDPDATKGEDRYCCGSASNLGDSHNVPALQDTHENMILTDVPYGVHSTENALAPKPDFNLGRIFADAPLKLAAMVDGYETPLEVQAAQGSAYIFNHQNSSDINYTDKTRSVAVGPLQDAGFKLSPTSMTSRGVPYRYVWYNGNWGNWDSTHFQSAIRADGKNRLTIVQSHANHLFQTTATTTTTRIAANTILSTTEFPGSLVLTSGCHAGYSTGFDASGKTPNYYTGGLVHAALARHITWVGSTTYGYTTGTQSVRYHDRVHSQFLRMVLGQAATTGEARRIAIRDYSVYHPSTGFYARDVESVYGTSLYGLPTQEISRTATALAVRVLDQPPLQRRNDDIAVELTVHLSAETLSGETDADGATWFSLPEAEEYTAIGNGPVVPLLVRRVVLPADSSNVQVSLVTSTTTAYGSQVTLPLQQFGDQTHGVETIPYTGTTPYPDTLFWTNVFTGDGGVEVVISAVPLHYDPLTRQVTLIPHMTFAVHYTEAASQATLTGLVVDDDNDVLQGQPTAAIETTATTAAAGDYLLRWWIEDAAGHPQGGGEFDVTLTATNALSWEAASLSWPAGAKVLHVTLADASGDIIASSAQPFFVTAQYDNYLPVIAR